MEKSKDKGYLLKLDSLIKEKQEKLDFYHKEEEKDSKADYSMKRILIGSDLSSLKDIKTEITCEDMHRLKAGLKKLKDFFARQRDELVRTDAECGRATDKKGNVIAITTINQAKIEECDSLVREIDKESEKLKDWRDRFVTYEQGSAERDKVIETKYLIENTLSKESFMLLAGETGNGKTLFAMYLGLCLATGEDFLGKKVLESTNVLYIDEENKASILKERQDLIQEGLGLKEVKNFYPMSSQGFNFGNEEDLKALESMIKELKIGAIVVDSLAVTTGYNENVASGFANLYAKSLKVLTKRYGLTWVLIQHLSKGTMRSMKTENLLKLIRGSSALFYLADDCLFLKKEKDRLTLIPCKARANELGNPRELKIVWDDKIELIDLGASTIGMNASQKCSIALLDYCKTQNLKEFSTRKDDKENIVRRIRQEEGFSQNTVYKAIRLLKDANNITLKEEGVYLLV